MHERVLTLILSKYWARGSDRSKKGLFWIIYARICQGIAGVVFVQGIMQLFKQRDGMNAELRLPLSFPLNGDQMFE